MFIPRFNKNEFLEQIILGKLGINFITTHKVITYKYSELTNFLYNDEYFLNNANNIILRKDIFFDETNIDNTKKLLELFEKNTEQFIKECYFLDDNEKEKLRLCLTK